MPYCSSYLRCFGCPILPIGLPRRFSRTKFRTSIARSALARQLYVIQILHPPGHPVTSPQNGSTLARQLYVIQILHPPGHPVTSPQNGSTLARQLYVIQILHPPGHPVTSPQNGHTVVHISHATPLTTRLRTPALTANKASRRKRPVLLRFCLRESQHFLAHNSQKRRPTDRYSSCNEVLVANSRKCTYNRTASAMAKVKWRCKLTIRPSASDPGIKDQIIEPCDQWRHVFQPNSTAVCDRIREVRRRMLCQNWRCSGQQLRSGYARQIFVPSFNSTDRRVHKKYSFQTIEEPRFDSRQGQESFVFQTPAQSPTQRESLCGVTPPLSHASSWSCT